jgi:hypothetical protein
MTQQDRNQLRLNALRDQLNKLGNKSDDASISKRIAVKVALAELEDSMG